MPEIEQPDTLADDVADLVLDSATEWLKYVQFSDGSQAKMTWSYGNIVRVEHTETGHVAEFQVTVNATRLPPPGPEDDGALRAELAEELVWALRTWTDVRSGDTVRPPGREVTAEIATAVLMCWNVDPRTGTSSWNPPVALPHEVMNVRFTHEPDVVRGMDPTKPVEIHLARGEVEALDVLGDAIGWTERIGLVVVTQNPDGTMRGELR